MKKLLLFTFALFLWTGAWADSKTVYFDPTSNWDHSTAVFSVYTWGAGKDDAWINLDGKKTATINGYSCYEVEIPDGYTGMKFVRQDPNGNRTDWSSRWNETSDITVANSTLYTITNGDATSSYSTATVNTYTAKFVTNKNWTTTNAYAWSGDGGSAIKNLGDWGGTPMTQDGTYSSLGASSKIYSISFKAAPAPEKIIFNNGDNPGEEGNTKTADLTFVDGKTYFLGTEENLAYGKTVSWGDDANHTEAINGDATLSNLTDGNDATNVQVMLNGDATVMSVVLDLSEAKTFNSLLINQTGDRWNTSFQIYVSNDNSTWTEVTTNSMGITSGRFIATFTAQTARYVKYYTTRANKNVTDQYGASLAEIQLYNLASVPTVASIELSASTMGPIIADEQVILTAVGSSSIDGVQIGLGTITWNNDNTDAGTITDGVYTAKAAGTSNVSATYGGVTSNAISITVVNAVKIDLSTNNAYRIYPIEETLNDGKSNAFDSDANSLWTLHGGTAADESSRTYNTGFIADLGGEYDITGISIKFEGACSQTFGLAFAGTDGVFGENVYNGGHNATATHTEEFSGASVTNARYVKFLSTKAQSQYGVKIMDFTIHGVEKTTVTDTTNPTIEAVSEGTITHNSITLNITGNDNDSKYLMYKLEYSGKTSWISGTANAATPAIFEGLLPGKEYSFTITAYDSKGNNVNTNKVVSTTGNPLTLPVATKNADDVKSIFGQYGKTSGYNVWRASEFIEEGWSHNALQTNGENNNVEMTFTAKDVSDMDYLHLDIYAPTAIPMCVFIQDGAWKGIDIDGGISADDWKQIDIPMSFFKETCGRPMTALTNLLICKKVDNTTTHEGHGYYSSPYPYFIIGNIYFWKTPTIDEEAPVMTKAETSTVKYSTATLTVSATDNSGGTLTYIVKNGDTEVGRTTGIAGSDANVTVTGLTPETEYTLTVTATDHADNVSAGLNVNFTTTSAPDMYDDDVTIDDDHLISYHFELIQNEFSVTASFEKTNEVSAGAGQIRYRINTSGDNWINAAEYTWENCTPGDVIEVQYWWDSTGRRYSQTYQYTVKTPTIGVTITAAGWASFSSNKNLNFDGVENLSAYKATVDGTNDVTLVEVTEVKAGEGIILKGTAGEYNVPIMASAPEALEGNLLKPGYHKVTSEEVGSIYAFGKYNGGVAFVKAAENYEVSAGRAYLDVSGTGAKNAEYLNFNIGQEEGETDGINKVNTLVESGIRYNLSGQRVGNDYKGIVIVNGRKVVIK